MKATEPGTKSIATYRYIFNRNQSSKLSQDEQDSNLLLVPGIMNAPRTPGAESGQVSWENVLVIESCLTQFYLEGKKPQMLDCCGRGRRRWRTRWVVAPESPRFAVWRSHQHNRPRSLISWSCWATEEGKNWSRKKLETESWNYRWNRRNQNHSKWQQQGEVSWTSGHRKSKGHSLRLSW